MFQKAGPVTVILGEVRFAEPKFAKGPNDFDICVQCTNAEDAAQVDWWRGEVSQNYGKGNFATMTQAEITLLTLRKCGFEGSDLTTLEEQVKGKHVPAMIKEREYEGKKYYDIQYIGASGGNAPEKVISADVVKARVAALFGGGAAQAAPAPAAPAPPIPAPAAASSPFAKAAPATAPAAAPSPFGPKVAGSPF
jgi:hypothetical protein